MTTIPARILGKAIVEEVYHSPSGRIYYGCNVLEGFIKKGSLLSSDHTDRSAIVAEICRHRDQVDRAVSGQSVSLTLTGDGPANTFLYGSIITCLEYTADRCTTPRARVAFPPDELRSQGMKWLQATVMELNRAGYNQSQLAIPLNIAQSSVSNIINRDGAAVGLDSILRALSTLGVELELVLPTDVDLTHWIEENLNARNT